MRIKKIQLLGCLIIITAFLIQPASIPASIVQDYPRGGSLATMMNADAAVLNPMKWQTVYDLNVIDHIYEGLIRPDLEYFDLI
ncbi:MAG: hypothetical protein ACW99F_15555 [Candidatus Hodarchaeales archaeon]|jgi:hypothetical protein